MEEPGKKYTWLSFFMPLDQKTLCRTPYYNEAVQKNYQDLERINVQFLAGKSRLYCVGINWSIMKSEMGGERKACCELITVVVSRKVGAAMYTAKSMKLRGGKWNRREIRHFTKEGAGDVEYNQDAYLDMIPTLEEEANLKYIIFNSVGKWELAVRAFSFGKQCRSL